MKRYERMKRRQEQLKVERERAEQEDNEKYDCDEAIRIRSRVVGIRHRKSQVTSIFVEKAWSLFPIKVQRKFDNQLDPNAIAVFVDRNVEDIRDADIEEDLLGYLPASFCMLLSPRLDLKKLHIQSAKLLEFDSSLKTVPSSLDISLEICGDLSDNARLALEEAALGDLSRQHFTQVLKKAQNRFVSTDLITEEELQSASLYISLPFQGQSLYIKLLQRKSSWFIYSEEIDRSALDPLLERSSMIEDKTIPLDQRREILTSLLSSLTAAELRALYKRCVNNSNGKGDKSEILNKLMRYLFCQRCIDGSPYFTSPLFVKNFRECCSKRCRLSSTHLQALFRVYRLETLNFDSDLLSMERISNLKLVKFVPTSLSSVTPFSCRQQFLELESALELLSTCEASLNDKHYASAAKFLPVVRSKLTAIEEINAPTFWLQFHPATIYCSAMYLSVKALQKMQQYEDAVNEFMFLLNDVPSLLLTGRRRGKCWARLLLILDVHLKQRELALSLCQIALCDCTVDSGAKIALQDRALRLLKRESELELPTYLAAVSLPTDVPSETIVGRPLNSKTAERSRFFGYDDEVVSVEELALQYFAKDGWQGFHDEGCLIRTLFGLIMWDIIWRQDIPSVFMASYQDAPLDLGTIQFYVVRKDDIENRLQDIQGNMDFEAELTEVWIHHAGECCRGVAWNRWTLEQLVLLCACINRASLAAVFRLLAMNYSAWTGGLPDLAIYHPERKQFRLVEVKGPNDRLSDQQRAWLTRLHRFGFDSSVLKVKPPDKKAKKRTT